MNPLYQNFSRYYHYGFEKEDIIIKCDTCKDNVENQTNSTSTEDEEVLKKIPLAKKYLELP